MSSLIATTSPAVTAGTSSGNQPLIAVQSDPNNGLEPALSARFFNRLAKLDLPVVVQLHVPFPSTARALPPEEMRVTIDLSSSHQQSLIAESTDGALWVKTTNSTTKLVIAGRDTDHVHRIWDQVEPRIREFEPRIEGQIVHLWTNAPWGQDANIQEINAYRWADARRNYSASTAADVDELMNMDGPPAKGRLILWHGAPGTGKTSAAINLATEWASWADTHLVTDPEQLFVNPSYLLDVMHHEPAAHAGLSLPSSSTPPKERWKLIICEDADEYLRTDAREKSGPALGLLLNATDGILSRRSKCIFLLTTNDDISRLHPALTRPGRCLSEVEFTALNRVEVAEWCPPDLSAPNGPATIAELFALLNDGLSVNAVDELGMYL